MQPLSLSVVPRPLRLHGQAYRIDHILGFFRIWEIPGHGVSGLLGKFSPAVPLHIHELEARGISDTGRLTRPYITSGLLQAAFGEGWDAVVRACPTTRPLRGWLSPLGAPPGRGVRGRARPAWNSCPTVCARWSPQPAASWSAHGAYAPLPSPSPAAPLVLHPWVMRAAWCDSCAGVALPGARNGGVRRRRPVASAAGVRHGGANKKCERLCTGRALL